MKRFLKKLSFFLLDLLRPFFNLWVQRKKKFFSGLRVFLKDPYLCGMISQFNVWHEWIFNPYFEKVRVDPDELAYLKELSKKGTLVYVMKNRGQLEYSFFNHLFLKEGIPLAAFANGCRTLFWRPLQQIFKSAIARLDYYYERGRLEDPIQSDYLENLVVSGKSALLNLKVSRELIFGTSEDAFRFIPPLILAAQKNKKPIYLMTQQFLYDRHPEKMDRSWMDLLFGEKSNPGMFRKLIMFALSYQKRAAVKFGEAFDLQEFIAQYPHEEVPKLASRLNQILLERLAIERKSITGPAQKPREELLDKLLRDKGFKEGLLKLAKETGKSKVNLQQQATHYFLEIAASVNYSYVDLYDQLIRWMVNHIYDGLDMDTASLAKIKALAGKYPIVVVPSHKSHIDYLLLSYLFYNYDLTLPHICAGINLKFWPADRFIRRGGGFFIRRSFKGNKIYKLVIEYYLKLLVREGYSIEFFIEGTRSRTGKLLKPKMGILSMLVESYLDGDAPDIYFVPLSINYERIMEEGSYVSELQGSKKQKENVTGLFKARQKFRRKYGKVFIRFADPLSLKDYLQTKKIEPKKSTLEEARSSIEEFAYQITYNINKVSVVTSTALVAMSLLYSQPRRGISEKEILERVEALRHYLVYKGANLSGLARLNIEKVCLEALQKLCTDRMLTAHQDFEEKFYCLEDAKRMMLDYHKNTSLHFFVSLCAFSKILELSQKTSLTLKEVIQKYETLKTLLKHDFTFSERASLKEHLLKVIHFYAQENLIEFDEMSLTIHFSLCTKNFSFRLYASLLNHFFETSYLVLLYLKHVSFKKEERKKLEDIIREKGKVLYLKGSLTYPESLSQFNIRNALSVYEDLGLIGKDEQGLLTRHLDEESIKKWEEILRLLLGKQSQKREPTLKENFLFEEEKLLPSRMDHDFH